MTEDTHGEKRNKIIMRIIRILLGNNYLTIKDIPAGLPVNSEAALQTLCLSNIPSYMLKHG